MSNPTSAPAPQPGAPAPEGGLGVWVLAFAGGILLFAILLVAVYLPFRGEPTDTARATVRKAFLAEVNTAYAKETSSYGWVDQAKGTVRLPLARAKEVALPELAATEGSIFPAGDGSPVPPEVLARARATVPGQ